MSAVLTLDLGNQRAKLRRWLPDVSGWRLVNALALEHAECLPQASEAFAAERLLVSSVTNPGLEARWTHWAAGLGLVPVHPVPPLELRVRVPESVGLDRQWAAAGACLRSESALVCDVGTAITVDAAADGAFLGGTIGPGPRLVRDALHAHTAKLPAIELEPTSRALGGSTEEALAAGIVLGLRGAAESLVERLAEEAGFAPDVPVVLTGGARRFLIEPEPFTRRELLVEPELVHLGLLSTLGS